MNTKYKRYQDGKVPQYDTYFYAEAGMSEIMKNDCRLLELYTLRDQQYKIKSEIEEYEELLTDYKRKNKEYKQGRYNRGLPNWNKELNLNEKYRFEALLDFRNTELAKVETAIKIKEEEEKQTFHRDCMPNGPQGSFKINPNTGRGWIDGQDVEIVKGRPVIVDERSQYRGMTVMDYRKYIVVASGMKLKEAKQKYQDAMAKGNHKNVSNPANWKRPLIPWPKGIKNYLSGEESTSMKRTKSRKKN